MLKQQKSVCRLTLLTVIFIFLVSTGLPAFPVQAAMSDNPPHTSGAFLWARRMGGANQDTGQSIALDASGSVYTTGSFEGTVDFDPGPDTFNLTSAGDWDIFLSKLDNNGNFLWAKRMGGTNTDSGHDIAIDSSGNLYITGEFRDTADFDPGPDTYNLTSAGLSNIFVSKLDSHGTFLWAKRMGSTGQDSSTSITVDSSGCIYTTGSFEALADFDPDAGTFFLTSAGYFDIFVSKLNADGSFAWAKGMGGTGFDFGQDIALDSNGSVYTTGSFEEIADFDPSPGIFSQDSAGQDDIFVTKLDHSGDFLWAKRMGGISYDQGEGIAIDSSDNIYTTGSFEDGVDFDPGSNVFNLINAGDYYSDIFVSKLDGNGNFIWAKGMGGYGWDTALDIGVDAIDNVCITGFFEGGADFDPGPAYFSLPDAKGFDIFIAKLNGSGSFIGATGMGGNGLDYGHSISIDSVGNVYLTGTFQETVDFDPGEGNFSLNSAGEYDIYTLKLERPNLQLLIAGKTWGEYNYPLSSEKRVSFAEVNNGPVQVNSLKVLPIISSQQVLYGGGSYSEMMGLPKEQLSKEYLFPYYNNVAMDSQLRVSNVGGANTTIKVYLGSSPLPIDQYNLPAGGATRKRYANKNNGPLRVTSSASNILATVRVLYNVNSSSEMMGLPVEQLAKEYLFPYYNNVAMNSQLRVSNVGGADTTITVYLGTTQIDSYALAAGGATRKNYTGKNSGPLRVSSSASNILATVRVLYGTNSYSELMGFPTGQLGQEYWYPVYDNVAVDSQLRVSNVGSDVTTITVYAGGTQIDQYTLAAGGATRKNYTGKNTGPLHMVSSSQPILTTIRLLYGNSYYEITGLPNSQLSTQYFFPWYNNTAMNSELRVAVVLFPLISP
jgi:hypothetical protein